MDREKHILDNDRIGRLLLKISGPAMIAMMVNALYNVVDAIFVGRGVGTLGIAGVSIVFPIQIFILAIALMIGIGSASIISRSLGAKKYQRAYETVGTAVLSVTVLGIIAAVFGSVFLNRLLIIFGSTEAILHYAQEYARIVLMGSIFFSFTVATNNIVRAEGRAVIAMTSMIIGAVLNIILDPIFIFGLDMGIRGAALATVIAHIVTSFYLLLYFQFGNSSLKIRWQYLRIRLKILGEIAAVGSASFVRQLSFSALAAILNNILKGFGGDVPIAVFGIINRINSFVMMPMLGIAQGVQPIVGFNYGARRFDRLLKTLRLGLKSTSMVGLFGFAILLLIPGVLFGLFTQDAELRRLGVEAMRIFALGVPVIGFLIIGGSLFQAIGKAKHALFLSLARQILIVTMVLILPRFYGLNGVWISFPLANVLFTGVTLLLYLPQIREFHNC